MTNPQYLVNISWYPNRATGQTAVNIGGVTSSVPSYTGNYFIATMPEVRLGSYGESISSTGSTYGDALTNLLALAASASNTGLPPINNTRN